jgi:hypothetical protein
MNEIAGLASKIIVPFSEAQQMSHVLFLWM